MALIALFAVGALLVAVGAALIFLPAGLIVLGAIAMLVAYRIAEEG